MSQALPPTPAPQYQDVLPPTNPKPFNRSKLLFTLLTFAAYILARFIPLPTYRIEYSQQSRDWSDCDNLVAVGIMPWIIAAVMIEIVSSILPHLQELRHRGDMGLAELRRVTNIFGALLAAIQSAWIIFDLTYEPGFGIFDPSHPPLPKPHLSSPILAFVTLLAGALILKALIDFIHPRTLLDKHGRLLAGALLLTTLYTLTRENSPFDTMDIRVMDLIRILMNMFKAGMLVAFLFLGPAFLWPNAPPRPRQTQFLMRPMPPIPDRIPVRAKISPAKTLGIPL